MNKLVSTLPLRFRGKIFIQNLTNQIWCRVAFPYITFSGG